MDVDKDNFQCCPLCDGIHIRNQGLTVIVTEEHSGWECWKSVCGRCFKEEWREFRGDGEMAKDVQNQFRQEFLHALNVQFCETVAVQVARTVMQKTQCGEIASVEPCIIRVYACA